MEYCLFRNKDNWGWNCDVYGKLMCYECDYKVKKGVFLTPIGDWFDDGDRLHEIRLKELCYKRVYEENFFDEDEEEYEEKSKDTKYLILNSCYKDPYESFVEQQEIYVLTPVATWQILKSSGRRKIVTHHKHLNGNWHYQGYNSEFEYNLQGFKYAIANIIGHDYGYKKVNASKPIVITPDESTYKDEVYRIGIYIHNKKPVLRLDKSNEVKDVSSKGSYVDEISNSMFKGWNN